MNYQDERFIINDDGIYEKSQVSEQEVIKHLVTKLAEKESYYKNVISVSESQHVADIMANWRTNR